MGRALVAGRQLLGLELALDVDDVDVLLGVPGWRELGVFRSVDDTRGRDVEIVRAAEWLHGCVLNKASVPRSRSLWNVHIRDSRPS